MRTATDEQPLIVGIGGTFRASSSTKLAVCCALQAAEGAGARTAIISGPDLDLPLYHPERSDRTSRAAKLVEMMACADGLIIGSPGYHGGPSGMVKNALDYAEDLRDEGRPYWDGIPVGCIACAYGWQATSMTLLALRSIVHALRGWPTPLGVAINSTHSVFGDDGRVLDMAIGRQLELVGQQVVEFVRAQAIAAQP